MKSWTRTIKHRKQHEYDEINVAIRRQSDIGIHNHVTQRVTADHPLAVRSLSNLKGGFFCAIFLLVLRKLLYFFKSPNLMSSFHEKG